MKDWMAFAFAVAASLVLLASGTYIFRVYKDYKVHTIETDRIAVVNSLVNFQQRYGQYPTIEPMKDNKKVDRASIELDKKIRKGTLESNIKDNIVEIDLKAMRDTLHISNSRRYYMIKGNPYTAFSWEDVHRDNFTMSDKTLMYSFSNAQVNSSSLKVDGKTMNKVLAVRNIPGNMTIVGGKGELYLAKVVDKKLFKLSLDGGDKISEVFNITDRVISTHLKDGSTKIYSIEEVYK